MPRLSRDAHWEVHPVPGFEDSGETVAPIKNKNDLDAL